jgi:hypothetical protein
VECRALPSRLCDQAQKAQKCEYFAPVSESNIPQTESEFLSENELELELFLNELRDNEFEGMMHETLHELEANFENYANQHGLIVDWVHF